MNAEAWLRNQVQIWINQSTLIKQSGKL
uniref:Uncharacterized protein n=1 Tax=Tetranychus urticae TaxID=32264 RepID=T1KRV0_TETUR